MDYPQTLSESDLHWQDLIKQCRTSGKSDRQWLLENNISPATFYYHVKQLRRKACEIPAGIFSGISETQEVVPLMIKDDLQLPQNSADIPETSFSASCETAVRLTFRNVTVEITSQATQSIIQNTLSALHSLC